MLQGKFGPYILLPKHICTFSLVIDYTNIYTLLLRERFLNLHYLIHSLVYDRQCSNIQSTLLISYDIAYLMTDKAA